MPKERIILLVILVITILSASFFYNFQTDIFIAHDTETSELEKLKTHYQMLIKESQMYTLNRQQKSFYLKEIERLSTSFFMRDRNTTEFGFDIETLIKQSGLHIMHINDIANGFQFVCEGTLNRSLAFLNAAEQYQYKISIPVCNMHKLPENKWQMTVQCFPVYKPEAVKGLKNE